PYRQRDEHGGRRRAALRPQSGRVGGRPSGLVAASSPLWRLCQGASGAPLVVARACAAVRVKILAAPARAAQTASEGEVAGLRTTYRNPIQPGPASASSSIARTSPPPLRTTSTISSAGTPHISIAGSNSISS